ncbi:MAG: iron ABC transporter permease [Chloroflexota bacterium]
MKSILLKLLPVKRKSFVLWTFPLGFLALFYFYPLANIFSKSFEGGDTNFVSTLIEAVTNADVLDVLWFTTWQAALSTLLTLIVGLPGAYLFGRYTFRGKSLLRALTAIPFVLPTVVVATAFSAFLGPRGWLNLGLMSALNLDQAPINFVNTLSAILVAHIFYNTTIILRLVGDFWSNLDPKLEDAARTLGANRWNTFRHVTLPLLAPAIIAACLLIFIFDFTSFGVILILGGPKFATMEVEIFTQTVGLNNLPLAAILSMLQLAATFGLVALYQKFSSRLTRPLNIRPKLITQQKLHGFSQKFYASLLIGFMLMFFVLPLVSLAARSVTRLEAERRQQTAVEVGLTLDYYRELSKNPRQSMFYAPPSRAIITSIGYASMTAVIALGLALPAAWMLASNPGARFHRLMDNIIMLPLGTSAITLGLGFIVAFNRPPLDLRASPLLIPLAHSLVAFPFVMRSLTPALKRIHPNLRRAAAVLGAAPYQVFRHIDLPLLGRALLAAAAFAFTISLGEFGASSLITRPEYPTIPIMIFRFLSQPGATNYGQAMALSTILMLVTGAGMLVIENLSLHGNREF